MDVAGAGRFEAPSWVNARTALGTVLFAVAFLAGIRAMAAADRTAPVWAARSALPAGHVLAVDDLQVVQVNLPSEISARYLSTERSLAGAVLTRPVSDGELLTAAWVAPEGPPPPGRTLTLPVAQEHAVPGSLRPGDRIDVLGTFAPEGGRARTALLARAIEVVDIVKSPGLVGSEAMLAGITVAVTPDEAMALVLALRTADLDIVRIEDASVSPSVGSLGMRDLP